MGYTREEVIGRRIADIGVWYDPEERKNILLRLKQEKRFRDVHIRARTKSGEIRDIYMSGEIIRAGSNDFFLSLGRDVTDTLKAEKALRESESRFRLLIENAPDGIFVQTQGRFAYLNRAALCIYGARSAAELIGKPFLNFIHPDSRDAVRERARLVTEEKKQIPPQDQVHLRLDGTTIDVSVSVVPIRYEGLDGGLVFVRDNAERKEAEKALRESERRYRSLFENMLEGYAYCRMLFEHDEPKDFVYLDVNGSFETLTGLNNVIGKKVSEVIPGIRESNPELLRIYGRVALTGKPERFETHVDPLGQWFSVSVYSPEKEHFVAVFDVITERKRAQAALQEAHNRLDQIIEYLPDATFVIDADRKVIAWNRAIEQMTGISKGEMVGKGNYEYAMPFYGERRPIIIDLAFLPDEEFEKRNYDAVHRSAYALYGEAYVPKAYGERGAYLSATASKLRDASGRVIGAIESIRDVTDRKRAEEALRRSEENYRSIFENSVEGIYQSTPEGRFISVNPAFARIFGYDSPQDAIDSITDIAGQFVDPEDRRRNLEILEEKGFLRLSEFKMRCKDGRIIWCRLSARAVRDDAGTIRLIEGMIEDINEKKLAEMAIHESERLLRNILEMLPVGIFLIDQAGKIDMANPAAREIWGGSRHVGIDRYGEYRGWWADTGKRIAPEQWNAARAIRNGEASINEAIEIESFEGTRKFILGSALPIRDRAGRIKGAIAVNQDITALKRAEKALREQARFLQVLIDSIPAPVFFKDREGRYIGCNDAFAKCIGRSRKAIVGKSVFDLTPRHLAEMYHAMDEKLFLDRSIQVYEQIAQYADGSPHDVIFSKAVFTDEAGNLKGLVGVMLDITEQKKVQTALKEREEHYRALYESSNEAVFIFDECRLFDCNPAAEAIFGLKKDRFLEIRPWTFSPPCQPDGSESMERAKEWLTKAFKGATVRFEWRFTKSDGAILDAMVSLNPLEIQGKHLVQAIVSDVTERKRVEELYRMLSDKSLAGVYVVQDGVFKHLNTNAASYAGYAAEELVGRKSSFLVHPEDGQIARKHSSEMLRGGRQTPYEFRIIDKAGRVRWILETVTNIKYEGKPAILGNSMDISQLKEAQQKLEELQALESSVLSAIPHAVLGLESHRIIFANDSVETVFGWKPADIIGGELAVLFSSEASCEAVTRRIAAALQDGKVYSLEPEHPLVHRDGHALDCRVTAARIGSGPGNGLVAAFEDITERKRAQLQLLQSEKMASIGQLAAGVAHEINNPTGYVSSNLKTLSEYSGDLLEILGLYRDLLSEIHEVAEGKRTLSELQRRAGDIQAREKQIDVGYILDDVPALIRESREGTERIKEIVIALKNFAHPGEEKHTYSDINKNIESTLNVVWNEIKYKATVKKEFGDLPEVQCFPQQLNQVFMNILVNAAQAIRGNGEICVRTRAQEDSVIVDISDTGCGIPEEHIKKIFDPFFTTKEVGKGTGLGLNVAYNIVKKHSGHIDVRSKMDEGTTFSIRIPVHQPS